MGIENVKANSNENILGKINAKGLPIVHEANTILNRLCFISKNFDKFYKGNLTDKLINYALEFKMQIYKAIDAYDEKKKYDCIILAIENLTCLFALLDSCVDMKLISINNLADLEMHLLPAKEQLEKWKNYVKGKMKI